MNLQAYLRLVSENTLLTPLHVTKKTHKICMLDEHGSPKWYDIVHFEHKLLWLCFELPQKASHQWREYSLFINP